MQSRTENGPPSPPVGPEKRRGLKQIIPGGIKTYQSGLTRWGDRLLPFTFIVNHIPGKTMGFADYFSRYPISAAPPISKSDKIFVINTIHAFTYTLKNAHRISINQNAINSSKHNEVKNERKHNSKSKHAFSLNCYQSRPPRFASTLLSNSKTKDNVHTRNRQTKNTFDKQIIKSFRSKNKMNTVLHQSNPNLLSNDSETQANKNSITIGTQINNLSNIGNGTGPLDPNRADNPFEKNPTGRKPNSIIKPSKSTKRPFFCTSN